MILYIRTMELKPKVGIDNFEFGLRVADIENLLGTPDKKWTDADDKSELLYQYDNLMLRLTFYNSEDGKLGYIRCSNPKLLYKGKKIIGEKLKATKTLFADITSDNWEIEDYDTFEIHFNENNWLTLNADYQRVTGIEIGVPFLNDNEYDWRK